MSYARELLRQGKAYLCFATAEELAEMRKQQQAGQGAARLLRPLGDLAGRDA